MLVKHFSTKKSYYKLDKLFSKIIDSIPVPDDSFNCVVDAWVTSLVFKISVFELEIHFSVSLGDLDTVYNYGSFIVLKGSGVVINLNYIDPPIITTLDLNHLDQFRTYETLDQVLDNIKDDIKWYIDCREEVKKLKKKIYITVW